MDERERILREEIRSFLRPTAKCGPDALTDEQIDIRLAKQEWISLREELGLSRRAAARMLDKSPSTIDGWERPGDFLRYPPRHIFQTLRRRAECERSGEIRAVSVVRRGA